MTDWFERLSKLHLMVLGFVVVACIGLMDYATGIELSFSIFYFLPVVLVTWYIDLSTGIIFSIVCTASWVLADYWGGHEYSTEYVFGFNALVRLVTFILISRLLYGLKINLQQLTEKELLAQKSLTVINTSQKLSTVIATNIARHNSQLWLWIVDQKKHGQRFPAIIETTCKHIGSNIAALTEICFSYQANKKEKIDLDKLVNLLEEKLKAVNEKDFK